jgi:hypothetical protein
VNYLFVPEHKSTFLLLYSNPLPTEHWEHIYINSFPSLIYIMRFTAAAAVFSTALLAGSVQADAQSVLKDAGSSVSSVASEASASGSSLVESAISGPVLPTFTVSCQF